MEDKEREDMEGLLEILADSIITNEFKELDEKEEGYLLRIRQRYATCQMEYQRLTGKYYNFNIVQD